MKLVMLVYFIFGGFTFASAQEWEYLLDRDLSKWETWLGIPHKSITGLPEGTYRSDYVFVAMGQAMGLNNDPKNVFSVKEENDLPVLKVTGEILGVLSTLKEYENYHLSLKTRWGDKKWPPRLNLPLDSGILFHCQGEHGSSKPLAWKACLEFQIMEGHFGDFYALGGTYGVVKGTVAPDDDKGITAKYDPLSTTNIKNQPFVLARNNPEKDKGQWNRMDLYVLGQNAVYVVNGVVVNVVENMVDKFKRPLTKGQIQLQSEAAEVYFSDLKIRSIDKFPNVIEAQLGERKVPLNNSSHPRKKRR